MHFHNIGHKPSAREMKAQTPKAKQLLNQWGHMEEIKGVLYRSSQKDQSYVILPGLTRDNMQMPIISQEQSITNFAV